jgi:hypothetical protein
MELRQRLTEVSEAGEKYGSKKTIRTELQEKTTELNKAARKKEDLRKYVQALGVILTGSETSANLQSLGMRRLLETTEAEGADVVGFGKHGQLTYQAVLEEYPSYAQWVVVTAREETGADARLRRLASWLEKNEAEELVEKPKKNFHGYPKSEAAPKRSSSASTHPRPEAEMMKNMLQTMEKMQEELAALKEERPRKKFEKSRGSETEGADTESSFQMVKDS